MLATNLKAAPRIPAELDLLRPPRRPCASGAADTSALTLLLMEDDLVSREMLMMRVQELFGTVIPAGDGDEALRLFLLHAPDVVLTDQIMPGCTGLELMDRIRATGARTPVVLMTSIDDGVLLEAINRGVERFIPKPYDFDLVLRTLGSVARDVANTRLLEQHRDHEVELLRYRDVYNSMQQESARRKERHVVRHDLRHRALKGARGVRWAINVAYSPHDITCGDGYSVRRLFDGRQLIFVVDAMGSGMSASLTAMLTTSFFNYQVEYLHMWESFTLPGFLRRFQQYLCSILLEEEVLSCGFFLVDLAREELQAAMFALPPLLLRGTDGSICKLRGENPPLGTFLTEVRIGTISLDGVADLLVMTDGVSDADLVRGGSYREVLEDDFGGAPSLASLQRRFREQTVAGNLDDLTLLHLLRLDLPSRWSWQGSPELSLAGLERAAGELLAALTRELPLPAVERDEIELILGEALLNAYEHGCLGLGFEEKARLIAEDGYDAALASPSSPPGPPSPSRPPCGVKRGSPCCSSRCRTAGRGSRSRH